MGMSKLDHFICKTLYGVSLATVCLIMLAKLNGDWTTALVSYVVGFGLAFAVIVLGAALVRLQRLRMDAAMVGKAAQLLVASRRLLANAYASHLVDARMASRLVEVIRASLDDAQAKDVLDAQAMLAEVREAMAVQVPRLADKLDALGADALSPAVAEVVAELRGGDRGQSK